MMRKMEYAESRYQYPIVLEHDWYKNYEFFILNLGTHPTAYVVLEEGHKLFGKQYNELGCINVHGELTYSEPDLINEYNCNGNHHYHVQDKWVIGWDYAHADDYSGFYSRIENLNFKKWTTEEIYEDVKKVINQLKGYE